MQLRGAADDGGGEDGGCKCHQEDHDHQERLGKEAVSKVSRRMEREEDAIEAIIEVTVI